MEVRQVGDAQPVELRRQPRQRHLERPEAHPPRLEPAPGEPAGGERAESAQGRPHARKRSHVAYTASAGL